MYQIAYPLQEHLSTSKFQHVNNISTIKLPYPDRGHLTASRHVLHPIHHPSPERDFVTVQPSTNSSQCGQASIYVQRAGLGPTGHQRPLARFQKPSNSSAWNEPRSAAPTWTHHVGRSTTHCLGGLVLQDRRSVSLSLSAHQPLACSLALVFVLLGGCGSETVEFCAVCLCGMPWSV
ncbi:uncharacterized protein BKA78DRAFT_53401 [Phyllosticta capitalensis]|uniref:uncharacterized protein n=1 Tax=Phyllosticta capitalensis TaxID=121624 RepID=UPI00312D63A8